VTPVTSSATGAATRRAALTAFAMKAWKQPQQLWLRKAFFQVHLWAGLLLALYVIAIGISGSILVFKDELMPRPHVASPPFDASACTPQRLLSAMDTASKAHPDLLVNLASCPTEANPFYAVTLHPIIAGPAPRSLTTYIQSQTDTIIGELDQSATWIGFVERFHIDLLLKHNGRQWNGVAAAVLLVLAVTGVPLWWPGIRNWRRAFKVDLHRTWKRINWDLHSAIGIWTVFFTLAWAVTGIYFAWEAPFEALINRISQVKTAAYPEADLDRIAKRSVSLAPSTLSLPNVLNDAQTRSPNAQLEGLFFGSGPNAVLTIYMANAHLGDYTKTDFLYFDQQTGQHLYTWHRGQNETLGDWLLWLIVPLHFGTSWGLGGKIAWFLLGLALPIMALTGFLMYWNRWLRKQMK
jgi:uncharacterized iron-regulated membrane protein